MPYAGWAEIAVFVTSCEARGTVRLAFRPGASAAGKAARGLVPLPRGDRLDLGHLQRNRLCRADHGIHRLSPMHAHGLDHKEFKLQKRELIPIIRNASP